MCGRPVWPGIDTEGAGVHDRRCRSRDTVTGRLVTRRSRPSRRSPRRWWCSRPPRRHRVDHGDPSRPRSSAPVRGRSTRRTSRRRSKPGHAVHKSTTLVHRRRSSWLSMPTLDGATGWINSPPLRADELRGHVVLVNFWTLTCINWLRTVPHIRAWSRAYRDDGLVVVGVHTPEFAFEHQIGLVEQAVGEPERSTTRSPSTTTTRSGTPSTTTTGRPSTSSTRKAPGGASTSARAATNRWSGAIQRLLGVERPLVTAHGTGVEAEADWPHLHSPETYLGRFGHELHRRCRLRP